MENAKEANNSINIPSPEISFPTEYVFCFLMTTSMNRYYFAKQHKPVGLCNEDTFLFEISTEFING
jgi:hypothetical protein